MKKVFFYTLLSASAMLSTVTARPQQVASVIKMERPVGMPETIEGVVLHRIQLRITTSTLEHSQNDNGVFVQMNEHDDKFYLVRGIDNFERGRTDTYDLLSSSVNKVEDIQFLRLGVKSDDSWRVQKLELFFNDNERPVFSKSFHAGGIELDNGQSFTISGSELRASAGWRFTSNNSKDIWKTPQYLSKKTLLSMVEAAVGDQIIKVPGFNWGTTTGVDTRWGPVVESSYVNDSTIHFDLDLQRTLYGPNPEVDIDFDLSFSCISGSLHYRMSNLSFGTNWVGEAQTGIRKYGGMVIGGAIGSLVGDPVIGAAAGGLLGKFLDYGINIKPGELPNKGGCTTIKVQTSGDIKLY